MSGGEADYKKRESGRETGSRHGGISGEGTDQEVRGNGRGQVNRREREREKEQVQQDSERVEQ